MHTFRPILMLRAWLDGEIAGTQSGNATAIPAQNQKTNMLAEETDPNLKNTKPQNATKLPQIAVLASKMPRDSQDMRTGFIGAFGTP
jgi:hypothetical protein